MDRKILRLAIPNILSNLSIPLLGLVDTALMGHMEDESYIGAIALGDMIFNLLYWSFGFLRMGVTGLTAQAWGRKDEADSLLTLTQGMIVGIGGGIMLVLLQVPIEKGAFLFMDTSHTNPDLIHDYYSIRIFTAPATIGLLALKGWFLGRQNAIFPLILTIVSNALNIIFNLVFLKGFGLGIEAMAWGTLVAQYSSFLLGILLCWLKYKDVLKTWNRDIWKAGGGIGRFFKVNGGLLIRSLVLVFSYFFFITEASHFGERALSVNSLFRQFLGIASFGIDGFAYAAESIVGESFGAGGRARLKKVVTRLFLWGGGLGLLITAIFGIGGEQILGLLTNKTEVISDAMPYLPWVLVYTLLSAGAFIWDGVYFGATAQRPLVINILIGAILFFFVPYYLFREELGNHALWLAMVLFMVFRTVGLSLTARKSIFDAVPERKS